MQEWMTMDFWSGIIKNAIEWVVVTAPAILLIMVLALAAMKALRMGIKKLRKMLLADEIAGASDVDMESVKRVQTLIELLNTLAKVVLMAVVGMLLLMKLGVNVAPIIAGAGIVGLAVGFGAQELVRDVISGFFMLLENQIRAGDVTIINGTGGLVEKIGLRTVTLRDLSGTVHVFQNGKINSLSNMTKGWSAMVFDIGVAYKEDTDKVTEVIRTVAEELCQDPAFKNKILEPLEIFGLDSFGDSAVNIKARFKTRPIEQWAVGREFRRRLKKAFDAHNIEIPFPHRMLYWGENNTPSQISPDKPEAKTLHASAGRR